MTIRKTLLILGLGATLGLLGYAMVASETLYVLLSVIAATGMANFSVLVVIADRMFRKGE